MKFINTTPSQGIIFRQLFSKRLYGTKKILFIACFLLFINAAYAWNSAFTFSNTTDTLLLYTFEECAGNPIDTRSGIQATMEATAKWASGGQFGSCRLNLTNAAKTTYIWNDTVPLLNSMNGAHCMEVLLNKTAVTADYGIIFDQADASNTIGMENGFNGNTYTFDFQTMPTGNSATATGTLQNNITYIAGCWNLSDNLAYINGVLIDTTIDTTYAKSSLGFTIGSYRAYVATYFASPISYIEQLRIINRTLTAAEISNTWICLRDGEGCTVFDLNWNSTSPTNNSILNDNSVVFYYNITTSLPVNISFYINSSLNETNLITTSGIKNFTWNSIEGNYNFQLRSLLANTTIKYLLIDKTAPTGVINSPDYENSTKTYINKPFMFNISASDNNQIYSLNTTCGNEFIDYIDEIFQTEYNRVNLTSFGASGVKNCTTRICDTHTSTEISDIPISAEPFAKTLYFDGMAITSKEGVSDITYKKELDKYTFCYKILSKTPSLTFYLPKECVFVPNSMYQGHFVCADKYWIDFEGYKAETKGNTVIIDISSAKETNICFNSIGELNCQNYDYNFEILNDTIAPRISNITPLNSSIMLEIPVLFKVFAWDENLFNCTLRTGESYVKTIIGSNNSLNTLDSLDLDDGYHDFNISCFDEYGNMNISSQRYFYLNTTIPELPSSLKIGTCPNSITMVLVLWLVVFVSLFFMVIGFVFRTSIYGFLGGIMILICAWYISACEPSLGLVIGIAGIMTTVLFAFRGLN